MRSCLLLFLILCSTSVNSSGEDTAEIFVANNYHMRGKPCTGGNIIAIEGIQRLTQDRNIKDQLSLKSIPPGAYSIKFRYSRLLTRDGACSEQSSDTQTKVVEQKIKPGKHYEFSLTNDLSVSIKELDKRPVTMNDANGLGLLTNNRTIWISSCIDLFPQNKSRYVNWFKASSFSEYADVFGFSLIEGSFLSAERVRLILENNAEEMKSWCDTQSLASMKDFDYLYSPYVNDVKSFMEKSLKSERKASQTEKKAPIVTGTGPRTLEEISATMTHNKNAIYTVYNRQLRRDPDFGGVYHFRLSIDENGSVTKCGFTDKGAQDSGFAEKVCRRISTFDFGYKENSGTGSYEYPINFN